MWSRPVVANRAGDLVVLRALPVALVHGDFHPGNVLTVDGRVSAVLDVDLARLAPPAYELARALLYCTHPAGPANDVDIIKLLFRTANVNRRLY